MSVDFEIRCIVPTKKRTETKTFNELVRLDAGHFFRLDGFNSLPKEMRKDAIDSDRHTTFATWRARVFHRVRPREPYLKVKRRIYRNHLFFWRGPTRKSLKHGGSRCSQRAAL